MMVKMKLIAFIKVNKMERKYNKSIWVPPTYNNVQTYRNICHRTMVDGDFSLDLLSITRNEVKISR